MLLVAVTSTHTWVTLVAGLGAGAGGSVLGAWQGRKLVPAQRKEIEIHAAEMAMETVEKALGIARARIDSLEVSVAEMTAKIGELRAELRHAQEGRHEIEAALNLALSERARLQQQITDLNRRTGAKRIEDLLEPGLGIPDAIVMVKVQDGKIDYANEGVFSLLGYMPSTLIGKSLEVLVPEASRELHERLRSDYSKQPHQRQMGKGLPLYALTAHGETIPVDISLHPTGDGRILALMKRRANSSLVH